MHEIRALHDDEFVRVYQAYSDEIADLAVAANSFEAPRAAGCWSATRMTWIKPSAVWMAYRCGWTTMKDKKQARVLALDLSRPAFEELLMSARLAHKGEGGGTGKCRDSSVVVQWDPEREMLATAEAKQVLTRGLSNVRSIQIGLRGPAVTKLLDPAFVLRISDVTSDFREAAAALSANEIDAARAALWRHGTERVMEVDAVLREVLGMDHPSPGRQADPSRLASEVPVFIETSFGSRADYETWCRAGAPRDATKAAPPSAAPAGSGQAAAVCGVVTPVMVADAPAKETLPSDVFTTIATHVVGEALVNLSLADKSTRDATAAELEERKREAQQQRELEREARRNRERVCVHAFLDDEATQGMTASCWTCGLRLPICEAIELSDKQRAQRNR